MVAEIAENALDDRIAGGGDVVSDFEAVAAEEAAA